MGRSVVEIFCGENVKISIKLLWFNAPRWYIEPRHQKHHANPKPCAGRPALGKCDIEACVWFNMIRRWSTAYVRRRKGPYSGTCIALVITQWPSASGPRAQALTGCRSQPSLGMYSKSRSVKYGPHTIHWQSRSSSEGAAKVPKKKISEALELHDLIGYSE